MTSVTKDTLIGDILDHDIETAEYFFEIGMHCLGCPASRGESIADACAVHGTNADVPFYATTASDGEVLELWRKRTGAEYPIYWTDEAVLHNSCRPR